MRRCADACTSAGATLYALVTGRLPFQAADPIELFRQIREDPFVAVQLAR